MTNTATYPESKETGAIRFRGALALAEIFKVVAGVVLICGVVLAAAAAATGGSGIAKFYAATGAIVGAALSACLLAFCGHVLDVLVASYSQLSEIRLQGEIQ